MGARTDDDGVIDTLYRIEDVLTDIRDALKPEPLVATLESGGHVEFTGPQGLIRVRPERIDAVGPAVYVGDSERYYRRALLIGGVEIFVIARGAWVAPGQRDPGKDNDTILVSLGWLTAAELDPFASVFAFR